MEFFQELSALLPEVSGRNACCDHHAADLPRTTEIWDVIRKNSQPNGMEVTCVVDFPFRDLRTPQNPNGLDLCWEMALLERAWVFNLDGVFSGGSSFSGLRMVVHGHTLMQWKDRPQNVEARMSELTSINVRIARQSDMNLFEEVSEQYHIVPFNPWLKKNWRQFVRASPDQKSACVWQLRGEVQMPQNEYRNSDVRAEYAFVRKLLIHAEQALRLQGPDVLNQFYCETYKKADTMRFLRGTGAFAQIIEPEVLLFVRSRTGVEIVSYNGPTPSSRSPPPPSQGLGTALRLRALCIGVGRYGNRIKRMKNSECKEREVGSQSEDGEGPYEDSEYFPPLKNSISDATALSSRINNLGPSIGKSDLLRNPQKKMHLRRAVRLFAESISTSPLPELALVYFAGHGIQEGTDIFLVPSKASPTEEEYLKDECFSLDEVLATLVGTSSVLEEQRFLVIIDACRTSLKGCVSPSWFRSPELCGPKQDDAPKKLTLILSSSRNGAAFDAFPGTGSHSPLVHEILSPAHGFFSPGMALNDAIDCICESLEQRTKSKQRPHIVNPHKLKGIVLNPLQDPDAVAPSMTLELLGILRQHDLEKPEVLRVLTEDLGLEKSNDLRCLTPEYLRRECSSQLEKLKPVPRKRFIDLVQRLTAQNLSDNASSASTMSVHSSDEAGSSVSCSEQSVVALYNTGSVSDFEGKIASFLDNLRSWFSEQPRPFACLMILMEIMKGMTFRDRSLEALAESWFERCKLMNLDASLMDENPVRRQAWHQRFPALREDARIIDGFEELYRAGEPSHGVRGLVDGDKEHSLSVRAIDAIVRNGLIPNFLQQAVDPKEWRSQVLGDWHSNGETVGPFLVRADRFLFGLESDDLLGLCESFHVSTLADPMETSSFVAFCAMGRFQEMALFTYLALHVGSSETSRHVLQGFKSVVSSTRNAWSSENRRVRSNRQHFAATFDLLKHLQRLRPRDSEMVKAQRQCPGTDAGNRAPQVGKKRRRSGSEGSGASEGGGAVEERMAVEEEDGKAGAEEECVDEAAAEAIAEAKRVQANKEAQLLKDKWSEVFVEGSLLQQRCAGRKGGVRCREGEVRSGKVGPGELGKPMIPEVAKSHRLWKVKAYQTARTSQAYAPNRGRIRAAYSQRVPTDASGAPRPGSFLHTAIKRYIPGVKEPVLIPLTGYKDVYAECEVICEIWVEFSYEQQICEACKE